MVDVDDYNIQMTNSIIHNLNYVSKVLFSMFMLLFIIISDSTMDLYMINLLLLVIFAWSNINIKVIIKNIGFFGVFIFLILFFISIIFLDLYLGIFWIVKIIDIVLLFTMIGITTSYYGLVVGSRFLLKPFRVFGDVNKMSIRVASFLKFMSVMYSEKKRIDNSKRFRGVKFETMDFVDKIEYLLKNVILVFHFTNKKLEKLRINVYKNKFGIDNYKYNYRLNKWQKADTILLIINIMMLFMVFFY